MMEKKLLLQKQQDEMEIAKAERFLQVQKEMKKHGISSLSANLVSSDKPATCLPQKNIHTTLALHLRLCLLL